MVQPADEESDESGRVRKQNKAHSSVARRRSRTEAANPPRSFDQGFRRERHREAEPKGETLADFHRITGARRRSRCGRSRICLRRLVVRPETRRCLVPRELSGLGGIDQFMVRLGSRCLGSPSTYPGFRGCDWYLLFCLRRPCCWGSVRLCFWLPGFCDRPWQSSCSCDSSGTWYYPFSVRKALDDVRQSRHDICGVDDGRGSRKV